MKKLLLVFSLLICVTGCSLVTIENQSYEEIIDSVFSENHNLKNVSLEGYSYYLPKGVLLKQNNSYNSILYYNHKRMYLYVDVISYYHKTESTFQKDESNYVSMAIHYDNKEGYLEITKLEDYYFVEFMYHYAKIEAYVAENDLKQTVTVMAYILNNVKYNDTILNTVIGDNALDYSEETFNIFKPKRDTGTFLKYDDMYQFDDDNEVVDEDNIDLDEGE